MHETGAGAESAAYAAPAAETQLTLGTDYHDASITPSEAADIAAGYNLVAYGGAHGGGPGEAYPGVPELEIEYDAAKSVVDALDAARGDVLFCEGPRHDGSPQHMDWSFLGPDQNPLDIIESWRAARTITAFSYASLLADLKGVPVIAADITQKAIDVFNEVTGQDAVVQVLNKNWDHLGIFHTLREEQAANTVKDYALAHLGEADPGVRPTYTVLFGGAHFTDGETTVMGSKGIAAAFERLGLQVEVRQLPDALRVRALTHIAGLLLKQTGADVPVSTAPTLYP